jgi:hypothetical protein
VSVRGRLYAAAVAFVVVGIGVPCRLAWADSMCVLLAGPTGGAPIPTEVVNRVRGELIADGFHVELAPPVLAADRTEALRRSGRAAGAAIVVGLFVDENTGGVELYLLDALSDRVVVRRLDAPTKAPDQGPQVVARHAVSLIRANMLDFVVEGLRSALATAPKASQVLPSSASSSSPQTTPTPQSPTPDAVIERPTLRRLALEGGLGVLGGFEGVGPSIMPVLRLRFAATQSFQIRLTGAGRGSSPAVQAQSGSATVEQDLVQLDAMAVVSQGRWVRPLAAVGLGAYYAGVTGSGVLPYYDGRNDSAVALALAGTVGAGFPMARDVELSLELQAVMTEPGVVLRFVDVSAARMGHPLLLATLTVAGWI